MKHLIKRDLRPEQPPANEPGPDIDPVEAREAPVERKPTPDPVEPQELPTDETEAIIAAAKAATVDARKAPAQQRTCLVVDDSRMIRKVARRIVEALGFKVVEAENGEEALALCRKSMPHLVMTDWDMPVMTGLEFVQNFRALPGSAATKVVFCTSKSGAHDIHAGIAAGADEYVVKPFDELGLRRKLENLGIA